MMHAWAPCTAPSAGHACEDVSAMPDGVATAPSLSGDVRGDLF